MDQIRKLSNSDRLEQIKKFGNISNFKMDQLKKLGYRTEERFGLRERLHKIKSTPLCVIPLHQLKSIPVHQLRSMGKSFYRWCLLPIYSRELVTITYHIPFNFARPPFESELSKVAKWKQKRFAVNSACGF